MGQRHEVKPRVCETCSAVGPWTAAELKEHAAVAHAYVGKKGQRTR